MCLIRKTTDTPCIAEEDIVCYKVAKLLPDYLEQTKDGLIQVSRFSGPWCVFGYELNKVYEEPDMEKGILRYPEWMYIHQGFHSYRFLNFTEKVAHDGGYKYILECVIPKGSKFYNDFGCMERCSDHIMVTAWKHAGAIDGQSHCWQTWGVPVSYPN